MNNIKAADFLLSFPPALKKDENMLALGRLAAEELHISAWEAEKNVIYAVIDSLPETWLDVLAYDLHVDWYDYDYAVEIKRKIIKNSVRVHQKLGTKYAVENVLRDVYRTAKVEEWFEYGGRPYTFKIKVDVAEWGLTEHISREIEEKMKFYKNLRSHCDGIFYYLGTGRAAVRAAAYVVMGCTLKVKAYTEGKITSRGMAAVLACQKVGNKIAVRKGN